ncbi:MAG TPA: hypothetical protein VN819_04770, partial [Thermoplasmata archaeon]|nr:hypothetical protein [Thermoplasmata archaeon]
MNQRYRSNQWERLARAAAVDRAAREGVGTLEAVMAVSLASASAIALTAPFNLAWTRFASSNSRWAV